MAAVDSFVKLIAGLQAGQLQDDTDPNNQTLSTYTSPYDDVYLSEALMVRTNSPLSLVWSDGKTYTAYDSNGNPYNAPSCGWLWSAGGRYS